LYGDGNEPDSGGLVAFLDRATIAQFVPVGKALVMAKLFNNSTSLLSLTDPSAVKAMIETPPPVIGAFILLEHDIEAYLDGLNQAFRPPPQVPPQSFATSWADVKSSTGAKLVADILPSLTSSALPDDVLDCSANCAHLSSWIYEDQPSQENLELVLPGWCVVKVFKSINAQLVQWAAVRYVQYCWPITLMHVCL
jgi:hypothetical protein